MARKTILERWTDHSEGSVHHSESWSLRDNRYQANSTLSHLFRNKNPLTGTLVSELQVLTNDLKYCYGWGLGRNSASIILHVFGCLGHSLPFLIVYTCILTVCSALFTCFLVFVLLFFLSHPRSYFGLSTNISTV